MWITNWLLMYGIIRTNATLWAGDEIFYFQRRKNTRNKVDSEPKQPFSKSNLLTSSKNILSVFYLLVFHSNLTQMKCRLAIDFLSKLVWFWLKRIPRQGNPGTRQFTQENHLRSSFSSLNSIERNKSWLFFFHMFSIEHEIQSCMKLT